MLPAAHQNGRSTISNISGNSWDLSSPILRVIGNFTLQWARRSAPHLWDRLDRPHCTFFKKLFIQLLNHLLVDNIGHVSLLVRHHIIYFVINLSILREAPRRLALHLFGHCPNSDYTPPPHPNGHSGALFFGADLSKFAKLPF